MKPASFNYQRPASLDEALELLNALGGGAKILAGGQSLVPMMNFRLVQPETLIDINGIRSLDFIERDGDAVRIGALATHSRLLESELLRTACPLVPDAYASVAHRTIRNRGTLCGSLCHADPAAEMPAVMLACNATMVIRSANATRQVAASDFFQGLYETALEPDEMLSEVWVPIMHGATGHGFLEHAVRKGDFALVLAAAIVSLDDGLISAASIVNAGIGDRPIRLHAVEAMLLGEPPSPTLFAEAGRVASEKDDVVEDFHADRIYRTGLIRKFTSEVLQQASERAQSRIVTC